MRRTPVARIALASAALLAATAILTARPLDPPAGPVAPSFKTLTEVEPRTAINPTNTPGDGDSVQRIGQSGSYYLTDNLAGAPGKHTIKVEADNVTIDLNGFSILGVPGSFDGIAVPDPRRGFALRNGTIRNQGRSGVYAAGVTGGRYQDLLIDSSVEQGLIPGPASVIERVQSIDNGQHGFLLEFAAVSQLIDCIALGCAGGFAAPDGEVTYTRCTAHNNRLNGFELSAGNRATDCVSAVNIGAGFVMSNQRSSLDGCTAEGNQAGGFYIGGTGNTLNRCAARVNGYGGPIASGFRSGSSVATAHFVDCTSISNSKSGFELGGLNDSLDTCTAISNGVHGVEATGNAVRAVNSRFERNGQRGLDLGSESILEECTVKRNGGDGVRINGNGTAVIRKCQITDSGGVGMIIANVSVVEDCLVTLNATGGCRGGAFSTVRRCTFDTNGNAPGTQSAIQFDGSNNLIEDNYVFLGDVGITIPVGGGSIVRRNTCNGTTNNYGAIAPGNRVAPINTSPTLATTNPNDNYSY